MQLLQDDTRDHDGERPFGDRSGPDFDFDHTENTATTPWGMASATLRGKLLDINEIRKVLSIKPRENAMGLISDNAVESSIQFPAFHLLLFSTFNTNHSKEEEKAVLALISERKELASWNRPGVSASAPGQGVPHRRKALHELSKKGQNGEVSELRMTAGRTIFEEEDEASFCTKLSLFGVRFEAEILDMFGYQSRIRVVAILIPTTANFVVRSASVWTCCLKVKLLLGFCGGADEKTRRADSSQDQSATGFSRYASTLDLRRRLVKRRAAQRETRGRQELDAKLVLRSSDHGRTANFNRTYRSITLDIPLSMHKVSVTEESRTSFFEKRQIARPGLRRSDTQMTMLADETLS
ncbi:hypothetical protein MMC12_003025 [Toensbergia leucococca]|nr:hypothetical protein [Toensbergia leucococca]